MADKYTASDLRAPWVASIVGRDVPSIAEDLLWDGEADTFAAWAPVVLKLLRQGGVDCLAEWSRDQTKIEIEDVYGPAIDENQGFTPPVLDYAKQLNSERAILLKSGNVDHCLAVISYIAPTVVDVVVSPGDASLRTDPNALWEAITSRVSGTASISGPKLQQQLFARTWVTKGTDGKTQSVLRQVEVNIAAYQRILVQFGSVADAYKIPETALVADFIGKLPSTGGIRIHVDEYRKQTTLAALLQLMRPHAMDADTAGPQGLHAFVAPTTSSAFDQRMVRLEEQIVAISAALAKGGHNGTGNRVSHERRMNRDLGAVTPGDKWCSQHGWNRSHVDKGCYVLHPELRKGSD
jgi:hypothetical protein